MNTIQLNSIWLNLLITFGSCLELAQRICANEANMPRSRVMSKDEDHLVLPPLRDNTRSPEERRKLVKAQGML